MAKTREYDLINERVIVIYDKLFPLYIVKGKKRVKKHLENSLQRTHKIKDEITRYFKKEEDVTKIAKSIYEQEFPGTNLLGSKEALLTSLESMIKVVKKECL